MRHHCDPLLRNLITWALLLSLTVISYSDAAANHTKSASITASTSASMSSSSTLSRSSSSPSSSTNSKSNEVSHTVSASVTRSVTMSTSLTLSQSVSLSVSVSSSSSCTMSSSESGSASTSTSLTVSQSVSLSVTVSSSLSCSMSSSESSSSSTSTSRNSYSREVTLSITASGSASVTRSATVSTSVSVSQSATSSVSTSRSLSFSAAQQSASYTSSREESLTQSESSSLSATVTITPPPTPTATFSSSSTTSATRSVSVSQSHTASLSRSASSQGSASTSTSFSRSVTASSSQSAETSRSGSKSSHVSSSKSRTSTFGTLSAAGSRSNSASDSLSFTRNVTATITPPNTTTPSSSITPSPLSMTVEPTASMSNSATGSVTLTHSTFPTASRSWSISYSTTAEMGSKSRSDSTSQQKSQTMSTTQSKQSVTLLPSSSIGTSSSNSTTISYGSVSRERTVSDSREGTQTSSGSHTASPSHSFTEETSASHSRSSTAGTFTSDPTKSRTHSQSPSASASVSFRDPSRSSSVSLTPSRVTASSALTASDSRERTFSVSASVSLSMPRSNSDTNERSASDTLSDSFSDSPSTSLSDSPSDSPSDTPSPSDSTSDTNDRSQSDSVTLPVTVTHLPSRTASPSFSFSEDPTTTRTASQSSTSSLSSSTTITLTTSINYCDAIYFSNVTQMMTNMTVPAATAGDYFPFNVTSDNIFYRIGRVDLSQLKAGLAVTLVFKPQLRNYLGVTRTDWSPPPAVSNCDIKNYNILNLNTVSFNLNYRANELISVADDYVCNITFSSNTMFACPNLTHGEFVFFAGLYVVGSPIELTWWGKTVKVAGTVAGVLAGGAALLHQSRANSIISFADCQFSLVDVPSYADHPLQFGFGSDVGYYLRGAVVGNFCFFCMVFAAHSVVVLLLTLRGYYTNYADRPEDALQQIRDKDGVVTAEHVMPLRSQFSFKEEFLHQASVARFPSASVAAAVLTFDGTCTSSMALIMHPTDDIDRPIGVIGLTLCVCFIGALLAVTYFLFRVIQEPCHITPEDFYAMDSESDDDDDEKQGGAADVSQRYPSAWQRLYFYLFAERIRWVKDPHYPNYKGMFYALFEEYTLAPFACVEVAVSLVIGSASGVMISDRNICNGLAAVCLISLFVFIAGMVYFNPFINRTSLFNGVIVNSCAFIAAVMLFIYSRQDEPDARLVNAASSTGTIISALNIMKFFGDLRGYYKKTKTLLTDKEQMIKRAAKKQEHRQRMLEHSLATQGLLRLPSLDANVDNKLLSKAMNSMRNFDYDDDWEMMEKSSNYGEARLQRKESMPVLAKSVEASPPPEDKGVQVEGGATLIADSHAIDIAPPAFIAPDLRLRRAPQEASASVWAVPMREGETVVSRLAALERAIELCERPSAPKRSVDDDEHWFGISTSAAGTGGGGDGGSRSWEHRSLARHMMSSEKRIAAFPQELEDIL